MPGWMLMTCSSFSVLPRIARKESAPAERTSVPRQTTSFSRVALAGDLSFVLAVSDQLDVDVE